MGIKEEIVNMLLGGFKRYGLAGTKLFEDLHKSFFGVSRFVLFHCCFKLVILAEEAADIVVGAKTERTDKRCDVDFSVLIYTDIENVVGIGLIFEPCASVGVNRARVKLDTRFIVGHSVVDAGGTDKL